MEQNLSRHIIEISRLPPEAQDLTHLLDDIMDRAMSLVRAERGCLVLTQDQAGSGVSLDFRVQRGLEGQAPGNSQDSTSRSVICRVIETGQPQVLPDALLDAHCGETENAMTPGSRSMICVPMDLQGCRIGAIYLENCSRQAQFSKGDVQPLILFADQAATAIQNARLFQSLQQAHDQLESRLEERTQELFKAQELLEQRKTERAQAEAGQRQALGEAMRATSALQKSEHLLRIIADNYPAYFSIIEKDMTIGFTSGKEFERHGLDPNSFVGLSLEEVFGEHTPTVRTNYLRAFGGEEVDFELNFDGQHQLYHAIPLLDGVGEVQRVLAVVENITERKQAEVALRAERDRAQHYLDIAASIMLILDAEGKIALLNKQGCHILECDHREVIGRNWFETFLPDQIKADLKSNVFATLMEGDLSQFEYVEGPVVTGKGNEKTIRWHNSIIRDDAGQIIGTLSSGEDITEQKRAEEAIRQLYEQAARDAEVKSMLLQEINHRVKNNLTGIIGLIHTEQRYASERGRAAVQDAMERLIQRISALAQVHDILSQTEWTPVSLSDLATHILSAALDAVPLDRQVVLDVAPSEIKIMPNQANSLALMLNELATNTIKYATSAGTTTHLAVRMTREDDDTVLLEMRDNGPGYPPDALRHERHGVGLYLVKILADHALGGRLQLANDGGAVTTIRLRAKEREEG